MQIVLLPGLDGTGRLSDRFVRALPEWLGARVVSYPTDRRGGYAELLPLVLEALPPQGEFLILGESFSGPLALLAAARQPAGLAGVVLCATFVRNPVRPVPTWCRVFVRGWTVRLTPGGTVLRFALGSGGSPELAREIEEARQLVRPAVLAARVRALMAVDVTRKLRACPVPVLYVQATEDRLVRPHNLATIREHRPDVEVARVAGPHFILGASPVAVAAAVASFAARLGAEAG